MGADRADHLTPPENPTPPRDRDEAVRRLARAEQHIGRLNAEIRDYKYKYQQRERYCAPRQHAIFLWQREKGVCRDFLKGNPASSPPQPAPAPAVPPPAPPAPPTVTTLTRPADAGAAWVLAELELQLTAAFHRNQRLSTVSLSLELVKNMIAQLDAFRRHDGNVSPLRQRTG